MDFIHLFIPSTQNSGNAPTLLLLHGTGGDENDLISVGKLFGDHVNLLSVRGKVSENGMNRFFRRLGMGVFDVPDLKLRTTELADFLKMAAQKSSFEITKIIALGYSNGANIAGSLLLMQPDLLAGAILLRPMIPFLPEPEWALPGTKILLNAGKTDNTMNPQEPANWADLLREAGASVTFNPLETGHNLTRQDFDSAVSWFKNEF